MAQWYFTIYPPLVFPSTLHLIIRETNPTAEPAALILLILHY